MLESLFARENYTFAKKLLDASELRHRAITSNMANIETPGYQRVDLDKNFVAKLDRAMAAREPEKIRHLDARIAPDLSAQTVRPDGNNVSMENELVAMNRNSLEYQYLTEYVSNSIKKLKTAISSKA